MSRGIYVPFVAHWRKFFIFVFLKNLLKIDVRLQQNANNLWVFWRDKNMVTFKMQENTIYSLELQR